MFRLKDNVNSLDPKKSISGEYEKQKNPEPDRSGSSWNMFLRPLFLQLPILPHGSRTL